jgi:hypothetical protein
VQSLLKWESKKDYIFCVLEALVIKHAKSTRHIVICGLPGSAIFYNIITPTATFQKKKKKKKES